MPSLAVAEITPLPAAPSKRPGSICRGTDQDCLRTLIPLHVRPNPVIVDVTYGYGRFWKGLPWQPVERMDRRAELGDLTTVGDFRHMPAEWTDRFDLVVFDPPHITDAGANSKYADRYGLRAEDLKTPDITHLFSPVLREARRVLRQDGVLLAKLTDTVHRGRMYFQVADFILAARGMRGLTPCDYLIKDSPSAAHMTGHNWQRIRHLRRAHCYWVVVRKGRC